MIIPKIDSNPGMENPKICGDYNDLKIVIINQIYH